MIIPIHDQEGFPAIYSYATTSTNRTWNYEKTPTMFQVCSSSFRHSVSSAGLMWWSALLGPKLGWAPFLKVQKLNQFYFNKMHED